MSFLSISSPTSAGRRFRPRWPQAPATSSGGVDPGDAPSAFALSIWIVHDHKQFTNSHEKESPALELVDSSSGAIGTAVKHAIDRLPERALHPGRRGELLVLLDKAPASMWRYGEWGVKVLAAAGRMAEAIRYAGALNDNPIAIARACADILLLSGLAGCSSMLDAARNGRCVELAEVRTRALVAIPRSAAKDLIAASMAARPRS